MTLAAGGARPSTSCCPRRDELVGAHLFAGAVSDMEDDDLVRADREEQAVVSLDELPDFELEGSVLGSQGAALGECPERFRSVSETESPIRSVHRRVFADVQVGRFNFGLRWTGNEHRESLHGRETLLVLRFQVIEDAAERTGLAALHCVDAALDAFQRLNPFQPLEKLLIRRGILHDDGGLAVDGEQRGPAGLAESLQVLLRVPQEVGEGMDIGNANHGRTYANSLL